MNSLNLPSLIVGADEKARQEKAAQIIGLNLDQANNPDIFILSKENGLGIDEVRNLQKFLSLKSYAGKNKAVFIKEAQNLTPEAQNALLKTLEEPVGSIIVLTAPDQSLLLPTIVSRCQIVPLSLKPQVSLSVEEKKELAGVFDRFLSSPVPERLALAENLGLGRDRDETLAWLDKLTLIAREEMLKSANRSTRTANKIAKILRQINRAKIHLRANCNVRLTLEIFLLKMS